MAEQKYHIGKNGPAICRASPSKPGGRHCRFGGNERHGSREELMAIWEQELANESPDCLSGSRIDHLLEKGVVDDFQNYHVVKDDLEQL